MNQDSKFETPRESDRESGSLFRSNNSVCGLYNSPWARKSPPNDTKRSMWQTFAGKLAGSCGFPFKESAVHGLTSWHPKNSSSFNIPIYTPFLFLYSVLPLSAHELIWTSTPSNCYCLIRMVHTTQERLSKCLTTADMSCPVILPGRNVFQLRPQHIDTQLNHDCHLSWSA